MDIGIQQDMPPVIDGAAEKARQLQRQQSGPLSEKQKLQAKKVSQDFEAMFVGLLLKSMRSTVKENKETGGGGHGEEAFRSMLDQEYATAAVKKGGFGLAKMVEKEIIRRESMKQPIKKIDHLE